MWCGKPLRFADRTQALGLGQVGPFSPERRDLLPHWARVIAEDRVRWEKSRAAAADGPRVLIPTMVGGLAHAGVVESMLAVALTLRGAAVEFLVCDGVLGACQLAVHGRTVEAGRLLAGELSQTLCGACVSVGEQILSGLDLPVHRLSNLIDDSDHRRALAEASEIPADRIADFKPDGLPIGEHAVAGALRFFASGSLDDEALGEGVLRRYLVAGRLTERALTRLIAGRRVDRAVFHHGIYVPQGITRAVLARSGIPLVTWNPAYRRNCFIFSHGESYHHTMIEEPDETWEDVALTVTEHRMVADYLRSRVGGTRDWIWFHDSPDDDLTAFAARSGLDLARPIVGLFTNVMWDARLHFRAVAYSDQLDWVEDTVEWARQRPDVQLVIRVHPAEMRGTVPARQRLQDKLRDRVPRLPRNVFVVSAGDAVSTYALAARCGTVLVFGTKSAMEFAAAGLDVVTVGDAWTRGKGISRDPVDRSDYLRCLHDLPAAGPTAERIVRARRHAFHVFLRRMIPLNVFDETGEDPPLKLSFDTIEALEKGRDAGLDVVCDGILNGTPFIYRAERFGASDTRLEYL